MNAAFLKLVTETLREVTPEAYHEYNYERHVKYPYITFELDEVPIERNQTGVTLDINIFDSDTSYAGILAAEEQLKDLLTSRRELTDELNLTYSFLGSVAIPTANEGIKRKNIRYYIKTDWRKENGIC